MSEYLKRCRQLSKKPGRGSIESATRTVHTNVSYIRLLDYAERLEEIEAVLLERLKHAEHNNHE